MLPIWIMLCALTLYFATIQWKTREIGWHRNDIGESLIKYGQRVIPGLVTGDTTNGVTDCPAEPMRVFVPLCGKTVDMSFLASQVVVSEVVGIDGIQQALDEYAEENKQLNIKKVDPAGQFDRLQGDKVTLLQGDFFHLSESDTGGRFDAIYDRGSMVAIDPSLRADYVNILSGLIKPGGRILLVAIVRRTGTDEDKTGPPFSVTEEDVRELYGKLDWVESIESLDKDDEKDRDPTDTRPVYVYNIQAK
jgi:thiopurine S-methyltransferase